MKLFNNWFHPQIHGSIFIFTKNEDEVTVLYQIVGSLCFYVIFCNLLIKTLGNLQLYTTKQNEERGSRLKTPYFVVLLTCNTHFF